MKLIKGKRYRVEVLAGSLFIPGTYIWYFRDVVISKEGFPIFKFSDSFDESSVFYNLFIPEDIFAIYDVSQF